MLSGATIVSVVAKKGSAKDGMFALESATKLLEFYNEYFGVPFPLPKLDMIAAPGAGGFSAMENWGAILYFEDQLLLNPEWSTEFESSAGLRRHCPRDGASMVRQPLGRRAHPFCALSKETERPRYRSPDLSR